MLNEFISGGVAGSISVIAGQPLDTIKVVLCTYGRLFHHVDVNMTG